MATQIIDGEEFEVVDVPVVPEGNTSYERRDPIIPPTETLADGTLEITGFVDGIKLVNVFYNKEKNGALFTFEDAQGHRTPKYISAPSERAYIQNAEPEQRAKFVKMIFDEVKRIFGKFMYNSEVLKVEASLNGLVNLRVLSEKLWEAFKEGKGLTKNSVSLKLTFKNAKGVKPEYIIPNNNYIGVTGDEKYGPSFTKSDDPTKAKYNDIINFEIQTAEPGFAEPAGGDGFAAPSGDQFAAPKADFAEQGAAAADVFGGTATDSNTLNTPSVDLLD